MVIKKYSETTYEEYGIFITKHRTKEGYFLIADEDNFIYSKLHDSEQAAQTWLDAIIETLERYVPKG